MIFIFSHQMQVFVSVLHQIKVAEDTESVVGVWRWIVSMPKIMLKTAVKITVFNAHQLPLDRMI